MIYIGVGLFGVILCFLYLIYIFFFRFWKFSAIISSNFTPLCLSFQPSGTPYNTHLLFLMLSQRPNKLFFLICLTFWCSDYLIYFTLFSRSFMCSYVSPKLLIPSSVFFISAIVLFSSDQFFCFLVLCKILTVFIYWSKIIILITVALDILLRKLSLLH